MNTSPDLARLETIRERLESYPWRRRVRELRHAEHSQSPADYRKLCDYFILGTVSRFDLLDQLGSGGFGKVFLAADRENSDHLVALKCLSPVAWREATPTQGDLARASDALEPEVRDMDSIPDGCGLIRLINHGVHPSPLRRAFIPFIAFELIDAAQPIDQYFETLPCTPSVILTHLISLCDAVNSFHLHCKSVHCDIKPTNIVVGDHGEVVVLDFGLHVALADRSADTDPIGGTPGWCAPEQLDPGHGQVDVRADVYGLGMVINHLLRTVNAHRHFGTSVTTALQRIVECATADHPSDRFPSVGALSYELRSIASSKHLHDRITPFHGPTVLRRIQDEAYFGHRLSHYEICAARGDRPLAIYTALADDLDHWGRRYHGPAYGALHHFAARQLVMAAITGGEVFTQDSHDLSGVLFHLSVATEMPSSGHDLAEAQWLDAVAKREVAYHTEDSHDIAASFSSLESLLDAASASIPAYYAALAHRELALSKRHFDASAPVSEHVTALLHAFDHELLFDPREYRHNNYACVERLVTLRSLVDLVADTDSTQSADEMRKVVSDRILTPATLPQVSPIVLAEFRRSELRLALASGDDERIRLLSKRCQRMARTFGLHKYRNTVAHLLAGHGIEPNSNRRIVGADPATRFTEQ